MKEVREPFLQTPSEAKLYQTKRCLGKPEKYILAKRTQHHCGGQILGCQGSLCLLVFMPLSVDGTFDFALNNRI